MYSLSPAVCEWFAAHHGTARRGDLLELGVSSSQIKHLIELGVLVIASRSVYRLAAAPASDLQRLALACAAGPDVVVSHQSAGHLWGLRRLGTNRQLHVTMGGRSNRRLIADVVHRSHRLHPIDVVERGGGIRLTSPARTAFDLAAVRSDDALLSILEQLLADELCDLPALFGVARRLREHGRKGSTRFGRVLQSRPALLRPVGSDLELRVEQAIIAAGLPRPERQAAIRLLTGHLVHPDFFWRAEREALEVDHITWHGGKLDLTYDKWRDRQLRRIGIHVTRVTDQDVRRDLPGLIADLAAILDRSRAA